MERLMSGSPGDSAADAREGKLFALLSYVVPLFLLVPVVQRNNAFALFHAKQAIGLWIAAIVASVAISLVFRVLPIAILATLISLAFTVAVVGLLVVGAIAAWNERAAPLPLIGATADRMLSGIRVN